MFHSSTVVGEMFAISLFRQVRILVLTQVLTRGDFLGITTCKRCVHQGRDFIEVLHHEGRHTWPLSDV